MSYLIFFNKLISFWLKINRVGVLAFAGWYQIFEGEVLVSRILPVSSGRKGPETKFLVGWSFNCSLKVSKLKYLDSFINYLTAKQFI